MDGTVLVADDDRTIRTVLTQALTRAGCKVHATSSLVTLMRWVDEGKGDLVISDVMMPDGNGLDMLPQISARRPGLPVIVISAQNTIMTAIKAEEADAYDYLPKPFDLPDLMKRANRALETKQRAPAAAPAVAPDMQDASLPLVGRTPQMQALYRLVARVMNTDLAVMISGESGSGKSLVARAIHDFSDRRTLPFVVATGQDLAGTEGPGQVLSSARGGTILFDEVADLSEEAQARVVRMLDALGGSAPRIMATSQRALSEEMEAGRFRSDLYYRLTGVAIDLPSLRERVDDIPLLVAHFLGKIEQEGQALPQIADPAMALLRAYPWPGNVRQLENTVRRLVVTCASDQVTAMDVEALLGSEAVATPTGTSSATERLGDSVAKHLQRYFDLHGGQLPPPGLYQRVLREIEVPLLEIALDATGGNQARCADLLGINRNTLRKKITELDIEVTRRRKLM